jgi:very-short-patch-repair endonuclease
MRQAIARRKVMPDDLQRAKKLRREMSKTEKLLWYKLRSLPKDLQITFRRQQPIHPYIVDFICLKIKLVVELDGDSHDTRQEYDANRDAYLNNLGYEVLRFDNKVFLSNPNDVVATILAHAAKLMEKYVRESAPLPPTKKM